MVHRLCSVDYEDDDPRCSYAATCTVLFTGMCHSIAVRKSYSLVQGSSSKYLVA